MTIKLSRAVMRALAVYTLAFLTLLQASQQAPEYTIQVESDLVLVNVTVRDKNGNLVRNLKPDDFTILEDNKPQKIVSYDVENLDAVAVQDVAQAKSASANGRSANPVEVPSSSPTAGDLFKDRRLIVLFFDLSAMEPDDIDRAVSSAERYVDTQMEPADLVSIISLGSSLIVNQDFTSDHDLLKKQLRAFGAGSGQGYQEGTTGSTEGTPDTGQAFTADDTEYNIFNTDRRLEALRSVAEGLSHVQQKKSLIYFSSGIGRTGIENQSELRAAINAAIRSNLAIYTMDLRGLQAIVAGGEAQSASLRGTSAYSGQSMLNALNSNFATQETLVALASDTGGRAFLDSNDFSQVFRGVQQDTSSYYLLGYRSTNQAKDGHYRRIAVKVNLPAVKVDHRRGYYAPSDYQHSSKEDKELQLEQQLASDLPATDLPLYLNTAYFRMAARTYFLAVSLVVPGSEVPFTRSSDRDKANLDVIGLISDGEQRPISHIRDTVKLAIDSSSDVRKKNVQYESSVSLPPGDYHLKFVVRENQTGRMGSFETDVKVPDLRSQPLKMSSIVLSNQLQPAKKSSLPNPLIRDGKEIVPSVTHVFSSAQHLSLYYEVYEPGRTSARPAADQATNPAIHLLTNVAFFRGKTKIFESSTVELTELNDRDRKAGVFQLDLPLSSLVPGFYTAQVNVIDDTAGSFLFPRFALLIRPEKSTEAR